MKRSSAVLLAVLVVLASIGTGAGAWWLARNHPAPQLQISAFTNGQLTRVEPYLYCDVLDLNDCWLGRSQGQLAVDGRHTVQLSVDAIGRAPWRLLRIYDDPADTVATVFRPGAALAVTIPTVDPQRGPLSGLVVQLLTLVVDESGQLFDVPHAEWSIRTTWN